MEEQMTLLLTNILVNDCLIKIDVNFLDEYYQLFDTQKYIGNGFEKIYNDMNDIYKIDLQSLRYGYNNIEEQNIYKNLVLAVINEKDFNKKIKLIPLIIYLDNNRLFYDYLYKIGYFLDFSKKSKNYFVPTVRKSGINIQNVDNLPSEHHEKEWYENYKLGIKGLIFSKIYSFVEGFERGRGFVFDIYTDFLIFITYKYFFDDLVAIVNNKYDMFEVLYLINILTIEETLILANKSSNNLLKFEAIRKSVYFKTNNTYCLNLIKSEQELLSKIILKFSEESTLWQEFLDFYLIFPLRNPQLFKPLSKIVGLLEKDKIDMLIQNVKIDRYISHDSKEALNSCFLNIEDDKTQKYCLESLFYIWNEFIDESNDYFGGVVLTDIIDMVIIYVRDFLDENIIRINVEKIIYILDEIDNRWFKDSSEKRNYFYKQMSKLFVYGFAFEKYEMNELRDRVNEICDRSIELQTEYIRDEKSTLQLFGEYIFKEDISNN